MSKSQRSKRATNPQKFFDKDVTRNGRAEQARTHSTTRPGGTINAQQRRLINRAIAREATKQTGGQVLSLLERQQRLKGLTPRLSLVHFGGGKPVAKFERVSAFYKVR